MLGLLEARGPLLIGASELAPRLVLDPPIFKFTGSGVTFFSMTGLGSSFGGSSLLLTSAK